MLAAKLEDIGEDNLTFPLLASPKIDGVRAYVRDGVVYSRSNKPIPNPHVQKLFGRAELEGMDGELVVGPANAPDTMQKTMSGVMSKDGEPDVFFYVFDVVHGRADTMTYQDRYGWLRNHCTHLPSNSRAHALNHSIIDHKGQLDEYEAQMLANGYEGIMLRTLDGKYKQGRCGKKAPYLTKVKRFASGEATIVGSEELMHNDNEAFTDELGRTKRSTHQENKRPAGVLGALICRLASGVEFNIGTGFSAEQRAELWARRASLPGQLVTFKHFEAVGVKDAPRFPVFVSFRDPLDL
jgi:DNA ligase-1